MELTLEQQLNIEAILVEAGAWGLRYEVDRLAKHWLKEDPSLDPVEAYNSAYHDWIK